MANAEFWQEKLRRNRERDAKVDAALIAMGWTVLRLWEHEIRSGLEPAVKDILHRAGRSGADSSPHEREAATLNGDS